MANLKVQLKNSGGDLLFPRGRVDNLVDANGNAVTVPTLNGSGKIDSSKLPNAVDEVVELKNITNTAPSTCSTGDKYFNTHTKKIYTATANNTWGPTGVDPESSVVYLNLTPDPQDVNNIRLYRWTGSTMSEISKQVEIINSTTGINADVNSCSDNKVPSEKAVRVAINAAANPYVLPIASTNALGGIKLNTNVFTVSSDNPDTTDVIEGGVLQAVPITATVLSSLEYYDNSRLVTGAKFKSLVTGALSSYQQTLSAGTGMVKATSTSIGLDVTNHYDIRYDIL